MTIEEAKKLQPGDRVQWDGTLLGTIKSIDRSGPYFVSVHIEWDDFEESHLGFIRTENSWQQISRIPTPISKLPSPTPEAA